MSPTSAEEATDTGSSYGNTSNVEETGRVQTFSIHVALSVSTPIEDSQVASLNRSLRAADTALCIWRDEKNETVLCLSTDQESHDREEALREGLAIAQEAIHLVGAGATVLEVVAMTEEGQSRWTP